MKFSKIMGILNVTPDSFSDGNEKNINAISKNNGDTNKSSTVNIDFVEQKIKQLLVDGADIIDVGGESTRPNSDEVTVETELSRVLPTVKLIKTKFPNVRISVDTRKSEVAEESLRHGAEMINDVSGLQFSPEIAEIVAKYNKELVIMHSKGLPKNMQNNPHYENVVTDVFNFLQEKILFAKNKNVNKIFVDVGIGFGKTTEHNLELLRNLKYFENLETDLLLGISRKRFIGEITQIENPIDRDFPTVLIHSLLLNQINVKIIRVHNVFLTNQLRNIHNKIFSNFS